MFWSKKHKYNAKKTEIDGIKFDSAFEARVYTYLRDNNVKILDRQIRFVLQDKFRFKGEAIRTIEYKPDFLIEWNWQQFYIDAKGMQDAQFKIKLKMWQFRYWQTWLELLIVKSIKDLESQLWHYHSYSQHSS